MGTATRAKRLRHRFTRLRHDSHFSGVWERRFTTLAGAIHTLAGPIHTFVHTFLAGKTALLALLAKSVKTSPFPHGLRQTLFLPLPPPPPPPPATTSLMLTVAHHCSHYPASKLLVFQCLIITVTKYKKEEHLSHWQSLSLLLLSLVSSPCSLPPPGSTQ